ncbi:MAG: hypothetical protein K0S33_1946 [Bacteroidetes bacterium]|jgi:RHS repeat-associated protein|nr:hypothetical protein [Bacteroidota bacterium]
MINAVKKTTTAVWAKALLIFLCLCCSILSAAEYKKSIALSGTGIASGKTLSITDDMFNYMQLNPTTYTSRFVNQSAFITARLKFNEEFKTAFTTDWNLKVEYHIWAYDEANVLIDDFDDELRIEYFYQSGQFDVTKAVIRYPGAYRAQITVTGVEYKPCAPSGGCSPAAIPAVLNDAYFELESETQRLFVLDPSEVPVIKYTDAFINGTGYTPTTPYAYASVSPPKNELDLSWTYIEGAESYDLEWLFIDLPTDAELGASTPSGISFDFRNATRINTTFNSYKIPLVYPKGVLLYRVRAVGADKDDPEIVRFSNWSFLLNNGDLAADAPYGGTPPQANRFDYRGLDKDYNWSYTISFAEDGKYKNVIGYYDGLLRDRQDVTQVNTDDNAVVAESIFDQEGRSGVMISPSPVSSTGIHYYNNFNPVFNASNFDVDGKFSNPDTYPTTAGSGAYYSPANTTEPLLADAEGYPYALTKYTNDGTSRVKSQSIPGAAHRIGSGHELRFYYGTPTGQRELDRMFGAEVGWLKHYRKQMMQDENGQVHITYLDQEGRTIATAMAGSAPTGMTPIYSSFPTVPDNLLLGKNDLDADNKKVAVSNILVPAMNVLYTFEYNLASAPYSTPCYGPTDCKYDLEISVKDELGEYVQLSIIGIPAAGCVYTGTKNNPITCTGVSAAGLIKFDAHLDIGSYTVGKVLSVNSDNLAAIKEDFIQHQIENPELCYPVPVVAAAPCDFNCVTLCQEQYIVRDLQGNIIGYVDAEGHVIDETAFGILVTECEELCASSSPGGLSECEIKLAALKRDISPGGQYFDNKPSEFIMGSSGDLIPNTAYDINGWLDVPGNANLAAFITAAGTTFNYSLCSGSCTWDDVRAQWQDEWADLLVHHHPEWCLYQNHCGQILCQQGEQGQPDVFVDMSESNAYDEAMFAADYSTGISSYMNPLNLASSSSSSLLDISGGNSAYQPYSPGTPDPFASCPRDIVGCSPPVTTQDFIMQRLQNFLPVCTSSCTNYYSIWYVMDDPLNFHIPANPGPADPLIRQMFYDLHGNGTTTGILGTGPGQITKYEFFRSVYQFYKKYLIYIMDRDCGTFLTSNAEGDLPGGYDAHYMPSQIYTDLFNAQGCDPAFDLAALTSDIQTTVEGDMAEACTNTCEAYADQWIAELIAGCSSAATNPDLPLIRQYMVEVCAANCGESNSYQGTNGCPACPGVSYPAGPAVFHSFNDVIAYFASTCTVTIVHPPSVPDEAGCACQNFQTFLDINTFTTSSPPGNIATYLNDEYLEPDPVATVSGTDVSAWITQCASATPNLTLMTNFPDVFLCNLSDGPGNLDSSMLADCNSAANNLATYSQWFLYNQMLETAANEFAAAYIDHCAHNSAETFTVTYEDQQYQYTLFYYDQANNLVRTVPPEGVHFTLSTADYSDCDAYRNTQNPANFKAPAHTYNTVYTYNTYDLVKKTETPDMDDPMLQWYDAKGRVVASQTPVQAVAGQYSYILYDLLGRPTNSGQFYNSAMNDVTAQDDALYWGWYIAGTGATEITLTMYDIPFNSTIDGYFGTTIGQENMRNRISSVIYVDKVADPDYSSATHYSYDIHGNVKTLIQENKDLEAIGQSLKRMYYSYDLVSGNVNEMQYQPGEYDEYYYRYLYDGDNRLTMALNSRDGYNWHKDAKYFYYAHGPLKRVETGDRQIQGSDYVYTPEGWLKAVNGAVIGVKRDIGSDSWFGYNHINSNFGIDTRAFMLQYYDKGSYHDYTPVSGISFEPTHSPAGASAILNASDDLFNGNISTIVSQEVKQDETLETIAGNVYHYDQLNRFSYSQFFKNSYVAHVWGVSEGPDYRSYRMDNSYDKNGNIIHLNRYGNGYQTSTIKQMDQLTYHYYDKTGATFIGGITPVNEPTNRLAYVEDPKSPVAFPSDVDDQSAHANTHPASGSYQKNYGYDKNGRLVCDASECIGSIEWTNFNKVRRIKRFSNITGGCLGTSTLNNLEFRYDAFGHRIAKIDKPLDGGGNTKDETFWKYTYYVLDASGNAMAAYSKSYTPAGPGLVDITFAREEQNLFGVKRIGLDKVPSMKLPRYNYTLTTNSESESVVTLGPEVTHVDFKADYLNGDDNYAYTNISGHKQFEFSNHLGDVMTVTTDRKTTVDELTWATDGSTSFLAADGLTDGYAPDVVSYAEYYPFGMLLDTRNGTPNEYRYSYQGQEHDDELKGVGNSINYEYRMDDPRLGRFMSIDPLAAKYAHNSPYAFSENRVIDGVELEGLEVKVNNESGTSSMLSAGATVGAAVKQARPKWSVDPALMEPDPFKPHVTYIPKSMLVTDPNIIAGMKQQTTGLTLNDIDEALNAPEIGGLKELVDGAKKRFPNSQVLGAISQELDHLGTIGNGIMIGNDMFKMYTAKNEDEEFIASNTFVTDLVTIIIVKERPLLGLLKTYVDLVKKSDEYKQMEINNALFDKWRLKQGAIQNDGKISYGIFDNPAYINAQNVLDKYSDKNSPGIKPARLYSPEQYMLHSLLNK